MTEERFFYHCFPRKAIDKHDVTLGSQILELIAKNGFVLTPEIISWSESVQGGFGPQLKKLQRRICFTQLPSAELKQHCDKFGYFAIRYSYAGLRSIGGLPVFYVPAATTSPVGLDGMGAALACRLSILQQVLQDMIAVKNAVNSNASPIRLIINAPPESREIESASLKSFFELFPSQPFSLEEFNFVIDAVQNLLLPTENPRFNDDLGYYRQREWRIIENFALNREQLAIKITPGQATELKNLTPEFFDKQIEWPIGNPSKIADLSLVFRQVLGKHVLSSADKVLVPEGAVDQSRATLAQHGISTTVEPIEQSLV